MMRFILALVLTFACGTAMAEDFARSGPTNGVHNATERVTQLPQDANKPHLTVYGNPSDPKFAELQNWFKTDKKLIALKNQCHYRAIETNTTLFKERYASRVPKTPCVLLTDASGGKVAEFAGRQIPMTKEALFHGLNTKAANAACWRTWRGEEQSEEPAKDPDPQPLKTEPLPATEQFPWLALALGVVAASVASALLKLKEMSGKAHYKAK